MQIKITMRYHLTIVRMAIMKKLQMKSVGKHVEKREPSCTIGVNVNRYSHYGEQYVDSLKTGNKKSYDTMIPLLGIYPEKIIIQKDTCTIKFTAALLTKERHGGNLNVQ